MTVEALSAADDPSARPTALLPRGQLVRLSLYWLGLSSIFAGLNNILGGRIIFEGLGDEAFKATTLFILSAMGTVIAVLVQPTIGSISDYTISRWGRRKPYILIGTTLDLVFLLGVASSNTVIAIAAFMALLQFSSNFAQGPFQGYVPDLVPEPQVGLASALVGLFQVLGNAAGFAIGALAVATNNFWLGTMALGVLEFATMLSVVIRVNEGRAAKPRNGRSWRSVGMEAWGTDVLRERSFVWLVGSRWFVLMGMTMLTNFALFYFVDSFGLAQSETGVPMLAVLVAFIAGNLVAVLPAGRASDRVGRKPVIYLACAVGSAGLAIVAVAPIIPIAVAGRARDGRGIRHVPRRGLGAADRSRAQGVGGPVHGHQQRGDRDVGAGGPRDRRPPDRPVEHRHQPGDRAAGRVCDGGRAARDRGRAAAAGAGTGATRAGVVGAIPA